MQSVAVGWHVYDITRRPIDLAYVGLVQFLPLVGLSLVAGHVADRVDRRRILLACHLAIAACAIALTVLSLHESHDVAIIYVVLFAFGTVRAFIGPAAQSILPRTVPVEVLPNAVKWSSVTWQVAAMCGPLMFGKVFAAEGLVGVYATTAVCTAVSFVLTFAMRIRSAATERRSVSVEALLAGVRYVLRTKVILGTISLDLFAVLFGGAVALLPAFARDILHASATELGDLRSAQSIGAMLMAVFLIAFPLGRHSGAKMLASVFVFGVATVVFAYSRTFWLSMAALTVCGAADMISVVVRSTVIQLATPDEMRGRVSAVNLVFVGASNELGEFESGLTAQWFGVVRAAALGGALTCAVVASWAGLFPSLRKIDRLEDVGPSPDL